MAETGDWVTPRLYGKPWFEKPPLLYWGGAVFFKLFGSSAPEVAARLPSAISALFATLALAWLAWRTYGDECARWLLLLLPTSIGMIGFSHAAATDMPFAGMLTIAMVCAAVVLGLVQKTENTPILPRTPWLALLLFGFFLGLAVLAKGPAAIILCGGAIFFWAIFTRRWRDALRLLHPAAIGPFRLTALPVVHPLRPPQSRFLPHLHHRTQFQTLPNSRIPTRPTLLVLHSSPCSRLPSMDYPPDLGFGDSASAQRQRPHRPIRCLLSPGRFSAWFSFRSPVQAPWLYSSQPSHLSDSCWAGPSRCSGRHTTNLCQLTQWWVHWFSDLLPRFSSH